MLMSQAMARIEGRNRGKGEASWKFDGNTTLATYKAFLAGWEINDPAVLDAYAPPAWLSGEQAGESINEVLGTCDNERQEARLDGVMSVYETSADAAYWRELIRTARYHVRENLYK